MTVQRSVWPLLGMLLSSCAGNPQQLPVALSSCSAVSRAGGFAITGNVRNAGEKPISALTLTANFYRDFRYSSYTAAARLAGELDPGHTQQVVFSLDGVPRGLRSGPALRCLVTHIGYLDGTSADMPQSQ